MTNTGIESSWGGHAAFYRPSDDTIQMPERGLFTGTDTSVGYRSLARHLAARRRSRHRTHVTARPKLLGQVRDAGA